MFTYERAAITRVTYLAAIDAQGTRRRLHYRYAARGGMNQVRRQINRMVAAGKAGALCETVAGNVAIDNSGRRGSIAAIEIRTDTYDVREYFTTTNRIPVTEQIHHTCIVERRNK